MSTIGTSTLGTLLYEPTIAGIKSWVITDISELSNNPTDTCAIQIKARQLGYDIISKKATCHRNSTSVSIMREYSSYMINVFLSKDKADEVRRGMLVKEYNRLCGIVVKAETERSDFVNKYLL